MAALDASIVVEAPMGSRQTILSKDGMKELGQPNVVSVKASSEVAEVLRPRLGTWQTSTAL